MQFIMHSLDWEKTVNTFCTDVKVSTYPHFAWVMRSSMTYDLDLNLKLLLIRGQGQRPTFSSLPMFRKNVSTFLETLLYKALLHQMLSTILSTSLIATSLWYSCPALQSSHLTETQWIYRNFIGRETKPGHIIYIAPGHDKQEIAVTGELV